MNVTIHSPDQRAEFDEEMKSLTHALVMAFGDSVHEAFERIEDGLDKGEYHLHLQNAHTNSFGNAYGECLATHGWVITGFANHYSDGDDVDKVTVRQIDRCNKPDTILHSKGDEERVYFEVEE